IGFATFGLSNPVAGDHSYDVPADIASIWNCAPACTRVSTGNVVTSIGGVTYTVTSSLTSDEHPFASLTLNEYVIVCSAASTNGLAMAGSSRYVEGVHKYSVPPDPCNWKFCPKQISPSSPASGTGAGITCTSTSSVVLHSPSVTVTVYKVVTEGFATGAAMLYAERPGFPPVHVNCVALVFNESATEPPSQIGSGSTAGVSVRLFVISTTTGGRT